MAPPDTNILRVDILRTVNFDGINNTILFDNKSQRDTYFNSKILYSLNSEQQRVNLSMSGTYQRRLSVYQDTNHHVSGTLGNFRPLGSL